MFRASPRELGGLLKGTNMSKTTDITLDTAEPIKAVFSQGADREGKVPLSPLLSKGGNVYWGLAKARGMFGVAVTPPKGFTDLPTKVRLVDSNGTGVGGEEIFLARGTTQDGRLRVSGSKLVTVPQTDGASVERLLQVTVSVRKQGDWNMKVSAINSGGGGGGSQAVDLFE